MLQAQLLEYFRALEAAFDFANDGALVLLTGSPTPAGLRETGSVPLTAWLRQQGVRRFNVVAAKAMQAAER